MTRPNRVILAVVAAVLLALGLATGLADRTYLASYPDRTSCGPVLAPTSFIVSGPDDPKIDEQATCAALIGRHAPLTYTSSAPVGAAGGRAASLATPSPTRPGRGTPPR